MTKTYEHVVLATEPRTCATHGDYTATKWGLKPSSPAAPPFWGNCPQCDSIWQAEADARDAEIKGGMSVKEVLRRRSAQQALIPSRFAEATLWNWTHGMDQQRRCWDWAREFASQFETAVATGRSAVFCGAPGTGKTHLAIGILKHIIEKGGTGRYFTVMGMLGRIKDTYHKSASETEGTVLRDLTTLDILVIDEIGKQLDSGYESAQLFNVLDTRYREMKPTLLVSNLPKPKLLEFLGAAVVDRLGEAGGRLLMFDWASQRSKRPAKGESNDE